MRKVNKYHTIVGWTHKGWGKHGQVFLNGLRYWPVEGHMIFKTRKMAASIYGRKYVGKIKIKIEMN